MHETKSKPVTVPLSPADFLAIRQAAAAANITMAEWMRRELGPALAAARKQHQTRKESE